jgi:S-adenosylmethionine:diacylglycerol 3-amino-3-carboxypropyl transferase
LRPLLASGASFAGIVCVLDGDDERRVGVQGAAAIEEAAIKIEGRVRDTDSLELQAWMPRVELEELIGHLRLTLSIGRQRLNWNPSLPAPCRLYASIA